MKEYRPWGTYQVLLDDDNCKVKKIVVKPGQVLSYQSHKLRNEDWIVVKGEGFVVLDDKKLTVKPGDHIHIPAGVKHRIGTESSPETLVFVEVQTGDYFGEDDIVRIDDIYGRV